MASNTSISNKGYRPRIGGYSCDQKYLREDLVVLQLKERLQQIALPDEWTNYMLRKVEEWDKSEKSTGRLVDFSSKNT
jgi:hypothetical protein